MNRKAAMAAKYQGSSTIRVGVIETLSLIDLRPGGLLGPRQAWDDGWRLREK